MDDPPGGALLDCQAWHFHWEGKRPTAEQPNSSLCAPREVER
jgi:hypothetical protein